MIRNYNSDIFFTSAVISYGQDTKQLSDEIVRKQINPRKKKQKQKNEKQTNKQKKSMTMVFIDPEQPKSSKHVLILGGCSSRIQYFVSSISIQQRFLRGNNMKEKLLVSLCIRTCAVASKARARSRSFHFCVRVRLNEIFEVPST